MIHAKKFKFKLPFLDAYRLRILFRGAFLLLIIATLYLAVFVLQQEKQLSYNNYQHNFLKTKQQISATLRHPTGQLALLNPHMDKGQLSALSPVLLPFASIDFDDQHKVQQAIAMSGCMVQYTNGGGLCVGVGNNPWAGGFVYVAGDFLSNNLVAHPPGELVLDAAHRVRVTVNWRGQTYRWLAPFEESQTAGYKNTAIGVRGRLTSFNEADVVAGSLESKPNARPEKDFRGWLWQHAHCVDPALNNVNLDCAKKTYFSIRLPVKLLEAELLAAKQQRSQLPAWPPADLSALKIHVEVLPPNDAPAIEASALFDSNDPIAVAPFSIRDLTPLLLAGETLTIRKLKNSANTAIILTGATADANSSWHLLTRLIEWLPIDKSAMQLHSSENISTLSDTYEMTLIGNIQSINQGLSAVATRVSWFVGANLAAIIIAWVVIEIGIIRRITRLTKRAASLSSTVKTNKLESFSLNDMRGVDELGVLASCLHDLLQRVKEDVERESIRVAQERDMWNAVGHEIMSPLQSLIALHGTPNDPSNRYISRMQQAIRILYGSASPSEAFESSHLQVSSIDLVAFLNSVANNAPSAGIQQVIFKNTVKANSKPLLVRADEYSLEDVVTHVLRNADRFRVANSAITMQLQASENATSITIYNDGPNIETEFIDKIFEYGVSDQLDAAAVGNRGQGLFVAKTYMAKMGGTIAVQNTAGGVSFILSLQRTVGA